jgi:hypothetical protein
MKKLQFIIIIPCFRRSFSNLAECKRGMSLSIAISPLGLRVKFPRCKLFFL